MCEVSVVCVCGVCVCVAVLPLQYDREGVAYYILEMKALLLECDTVQSGRNAGIYLSNCIVWHCIKEFIAVYKHQNTIPML